MWFEDFQDGRSVGHLGYWNRTILAILNLYVTLMHPVKFRFNPNYGLEGHFKYLKMVAILDIGTERFYQFRSPCLPNTYN